METLITAQDLRELSLLQAKTARKQCETQLDDDAKSLIEKIECHLNNLTDDDVRYEQVTIVLSDREMKALTHREDLIFDTFCPRGFNFHKADPDLCHRIDSGLFFLSSDPAVARRKPGPSVYRTIIINDSKYGSLNARWEKEKLIQQQKESERLQQQADLEEWEKLTPFQQNIKIFSQLFSWLIGISILSVVPLSIVGVPTAVFVWFIQKLFGFSGIFGGWEFIAVTSSIVGLIGVLVFWWGYEG